MSFRNSAKVDQHICNIWEEALLHLVTGWDTAYAQITRADSTCAEKS